MKVLGRVITEKTTALEAMAMPRRGRLVIDGLRVKPKPNWLFFYFLFLSVVLHGLILMLLTSFGNRALSDLKSPSIQARIGVLLVQTLTHGGSGSAQTERRFANPAPREATSAHTTTLRPAQQPLMNKVTALPESDTSSKPSFNLEDFREQARSLAKEPPEKLFRGANTYLNVPAKALPDLADRPILEALSKRLGKPLLVMSEQILNDGSRFIRFSGNRCLHIPRELPFGRESEFTQTILLPTNCP